MPTIIPQLWYSKEAEEAANFYASIFPDSRVDRVSTLPSDSPSGPAGTVKIVEFTLEVRLPLVIEGRKLIADTFLKVWRSLRARL